MHWKKHNPALSIRRTLTTADFWIILFSAVCGRVPYRLQLFKKLFHIYLAIFIPVCYCSWFNDGGALGPLAAIDYKPRQARKGAAVVIDSSAGVWLLVLPPLL